MLGGVRGRGLAAPSYSILLLLRRSHDGGKIAGQLSVGGGAGFQLCFDSVNRLDGGATCYRHDANI